MHGLVYDDLNHDGQFNDGTELFGVGTKLADGTRAPHRGTTYRTIFALCYGLGLRGGEACALRVGDVDVGRGHGRAECGQPGLGRSEILVVDVAEHDVQAAAGE